MKESTEDQVHRLLFGLADQAIQRGVEFTFDGSKIYADEVANLGKNSIVCLANALADRLGVGALGVECSLSQEAAPFNIFPLVADFRDVQFVAIAPFVAEVFERGVLVSPTSSLDMIEVFESAARIVDPNYGAFPRVAPSLVGSSVQSAFEPR